MANLTSEKLNELYQKLPPDVKEAYFGVNTAEILQSIAKENNLTTEKLGIMADETGLLMLGITHPAEFISNLANRMDLQKELARKVAHEINEKIFSKIRESLRKIHSGETEKEEKEKEQPEQQMPPVINPLKTFSNNEPIAEKNKKDIFEQRSKTFRAKPEITSYTKDIDPYREPLS
ncbi:hypothetical protein KKB69_01950 [Patescibacteria group bacterium]|nr:hypothetical protein [Patescibacteria group bacterium]